MARLDNWPSPRPLEGVKSSKRAIFEISDIELDTGGKVYEAQGLCLTLNSRVAAVGAAGRSVVDLLLRESELPESERKHSHAALSVVHLAPDTLQKFVVDGDYAAAIMEALSTRAQVVILEEALHAGESWAIFFRELLCSEGLQSFLGAVLVCVEDESLSLPTFAEVWLARGTSIYQQAYLQVFEDAGLESEELLEQVRQIDTLQFWVDDAKKKGHQITLFAESGDGQKQLKGFICHHMSPPKAEFNVRFIFVPEEFRGSKLGSRLVNWVIAKASRMPQSDCRWISLDAAYEALVPWYEGFGFTDMTCGPDEWGHIW
eukprot:CAMPEP_0197630340 /NCGR_PEP_ID=MMETSP1338-20131121/7861_1 /TAXON_ID=43686 ORGANISM="Pelagodinium beii, Strain RCC1491" /NCGR_SAMPLE_ID=MMETSP1338 /ASSEMBLY_ACC=CAM_ASM_000754 /LENGTH=316 /DNA_ID=CAMNT_0043201541 /DNA_START=95 /DNA_END=1042 /DNA_ORIENTATION=+